MNIMIVGLLLMFAEALDEFTAGSMRVHLKILDAR